MFSKEVDSKSPEEIKQYYMVFKKKWKELSEYQRIKARIEEGEAKRNKRSNLQDLLQKKINSVRYPMQELELNYPTTKGKVYSEEEDRYLLCRLNHYGMETEDVYERIKKDITEFPVFRFDWFFKSRSPQELQRRCNTLLGMIEKEASEQQAQEVKAKGTKGKVSTWLLFHWFIVLTDVCRSVELRSSRRKRPPSRLVPLRQEAGRQLPPRQPARGRRRGRKRRYSRLLSAAVPRCCVTSCCRLSYAYVLGCNCSRM